MLACSKNKSNFGIMGTCCNKRVESEDNTDKIVHKILFLGSGGCGKSTLFKQYRKLYEERENSEYGFTQKDKKDAVHGIANYMIETMQTILQDGSINIDNFQQQNVCEAGWSILSINTNSTLLLTDEIANNIKLLWSQSEIKNTFNEMVRFYLYPLSNNTTIRNLCKII